MFLRLRDALRSRPECRPAGATSGPAHEGGVAAGTAEIESVLPHPSVMLEMWRQDVARAALALREVARREQRRAGAAPHARVERLLLALALDHEMVVQQPPPAAHDALAVAGDPDCALPRLVRIVERDPALVRGLMRHASSAAYAAAGAPASLDEAARRLGATGVQVAVLAGMAEALLARGCGPYSPRAQHAWAAMGRVGPLARALARAFAVPADEALLLGLLHDVGTLVLLDALGAPQDAPRAAPADGCDAALSDAFAAGAVDTLHEPLGGLTLLRWGVDRRAAWAVAHHHRRRPAAAPDRRSELVFLAVRLDAAIAAGEAPSDLVLDRWFTEGQLTAPRDRVAAAVARAVAPTTAH